MQTLISAALQFPTIVFTFLLALIALSRAGSTLFWRHTDVAPSGEPLDGMRLAATLLLLMSSPALVVFAGPTLEYLNQTAAQLLEPQSYIDAVMSVAPATGGTP